MATRFAGSGDTNPSLSKLKEAAIATTLGGVGGAVCGGMVGMFILAPLARGYPGALSRTQVFVQSSYNPIFPSNRRF